VGERYPILTLKAKIIKCKTKAIPPLTEKYIKLAIIFVDEGFT
jgi:hypothetical protein